ncbi:MAG: penicillin-binding transpeptidase domain-containing protein [Chloroflexota bacterium]|nr:penicillin-binding transpeptidase domain-containing protein [Chloroflexota bacterium]MDE2947918.1 penicillin-binding transpeptidase domain-containing protein [Chloroflexota bacterium]
MRRLAIIIIILLFSLSACASTGEEAAIQLGTAAPNPAELADLEAADGVARRFLDAWAERDFAEMHGLLTFRNRELTPLAEFRALYENAQTRLRLEALEYTPTNLTGEGRVLAFQYDITFHTRVLGSFVDARRTLHLVIDPQVGAWRVAWSPADIFPEMGEGARIVFEAQTPSRANIYDRAGEVLADQNGRMVRVLVDNGRIPDRDVCFQVLAEALEEPPEEISDLFNVRSRPDWIVDAGLLEPNTFIKNNDLIKAYCGAEFRQLPTRRYAQGSLLPHVVGHVGYPDAEQIPALEAVGFNAETIIGKGGVEAGMNDTLAGRPGGRLSLVAPDGRRLRVLSEVRSQIPESLWLTIDADLQAAVARLLAEAYANSAWAENSEGAAVVIMDVNNGEILAMISFPVYDGNVLNPFPAVGRVKAEEALKAIVEDERKPLINRATQGIYSTGSVMKGLTAVAALESGIYDETTRYNCTGTWTYGRDVRYDWLRGGHGIMSVQTGITNSCNPFFYQAGFQLNAKDPWLLPSFARLLGLGQPTGINTLPEDAGSVPTPDNVATITGLPWSYSHAVNLSIGQGEVQASPLQMLRLYAAIANGGYVLRPHLVRERGILDQRTRVAQRDVMVDAQLDPANLALIRRGMCDVVNTPTGTAAHQFYRSSLLDVGVCGKTGTAQVPGEDEPPHSWFIAYAPAKAPQVAIVTMVENAGEGSAVAAPLTRDILEYYYFGKN